MARIHALTALLCCTLVFSTAQARSQAMPDTVSPSSRYTVCIQAAGGYSRDFSEYQEQRFLEEHRDKGYGYCQIRWLPGHLLTGALEVGYLAMYSVTSVSVGESQRSAVPIMLMFAMEPFDGLELSGGLGVALLSARVSGAVGVATSTSTSMATQGALSYAIGLTDRLKVGAEIRIAYLDLYDDKIFNAGLLFRYELLRY
ncbi:MAG: hypothetical protein J5I53_11300 [Bradyrhizobiaceae bacterium]|nr:hypothetical protein [Bradyrhizobiaceae bacterium]